MPQWIAVTRVDEIRPGRMRDFELLDRTMLGVANVNGVFHAFDATCPHKGGPLVGGLLEEGIVRCPWHGYRFSLATGTNVVPGNGLTVRLFPVRVQDNQVEVEIP